MNITNETSILNLKVNETYILGDEDSDNNTHQTTVICYCRTEDEKFVKMITIDLLTGDTKLKLIKNEDSKNPSRRRQGVSIVFQPEGAEDRIILNIAQHKGQTFIGTSR